jgi:hypothetical protein
MLNPQRQRQQKGAACLQQWQGVCRVSRRFLRYADSFTEPVMFVFCPDIGGKKSTPCVFEKGEILKNYTSL